MKKRFNGGILHEYRELFQFFSKTIIRICLLVNKRINTIKTLIARFLIFWNLGKAIVAFTALSILAGCIEIFKALTYLTISQEWIPERWLHPVIVCVGLGDLYISKSIGYKFVELVTKLFSVDIARVAVFVCALLCAYIILCSIKQYTVSQRISAFIKSNAELIPIAVQQGFVSSNLTAIDICVWTFATTFTRFTFGTFAWNLIKTPSITNPKTTE